MKWSISYFLVSYTFYFILYLFTRFPHFKATLMIEIAGDIAFNDKFYNENILLLGHS